MTGAVLLAGGSGARFGGPKQLAMLGARPLVEWSLQLFESVGAIAEVIVVSAASNLEEMERIARGFSKVRKVVPGGVTRTASSMAGISALSAETSVVLIHDAARPLASPELVGRVIDGLDGADGCIPAVRVTDTIKRVQDDLIAETIPRDDLVAVQTPQCFRVEVMKAACLQAEDSGFVGPDDASLLEALGRRVRWVEGDTANIKVTHPQDLEYAARSLGLVV